MKTTIALILLGALIIAGCAQQVPTGNQPPVDQNPQACTEEAKICPDGSAVGRNPDKNCEFDECPALQPTNQTLAPIYEDKRWVEFSREKCAATTWVCPEGTEQFFDDSGCGCQAPQNRNYTSTDTDQCSRMLFMCVAPLVPFFDETGCGCGFNWPAEYASASSTGIPKQDGKLQATDCTDPRPEVCTKEYMPVCGQKADGESSTYGNKCTACADTNVTSYYDGECSAPGGAAGGTMPAFENVCTDEQKAAEACTLQYDPVCGDDLQTYGNSCQACSSGNIDAWRPGECGPETQNPIVS